MVMTFVPFQVVGLFRAARAWSGPSGFRERKRTGQRGEPSDRSLLTHVVDPFWVVIPSAVKILLARS